MWVKLEREEIEEIKKAEGQEIAKTIELLCNNYDIMLAGDLYCMGNDCMAGDFIYNGGQRAYTINTYHIQKLIDGNGIHLKKLSNKELQEIINTMYGE